jgi:putative endonuclease
MLPIYAVYILKCSNGQYYTGFTKNMLRRLKEHLTGQVSYTKNKRPIVLVHISLFEDLQKAYDFERYLKSGSGKAFMKRHLV